jgi:hypothetical protein
MFPDGLDQMNKLCIHWDLRSPSSCNRLMVTATGTDYKGIGANCNDCANSIARSVRQFLTRCCTCLPALTILLNDTLCPFVVIVCFERAYSCH